MDAVAPLVTLVLVFGTGISLGPKANREFFRNFGRGIWRKLKKAVTASEVDVLSD